jgi:hypothetical protein
MPDPARLTPELCQEKAAQARFMTRLTDREPARIMLEHIAETWERMARRLVETD